jgi:hypothetical protein
MLVLTQTVSNLLFDICKVSISAIWIALFASIAMIVNNYSLVQIAQTSYISLIKRIIFYPELLNILPITIIPVISFIPTIFTLLWPVQLVSQVGPLLNVRVLTQNYGYQRTPYLATTGYDEDL